MMNSNNKVEHKIKDWKRSDTEVFWGEIAPCDHLVQIYESDEVIMNSLEGFVISGINAGESVIIIATAEHIKGLNRRLILNGLEIDHLLKNSQYIPLSAESTLEKFMVNGWPDDKKFMSTVTSIVNKAKGTEKRKVRAYGEMVALLWAQGNNGATVHLEHLWNKFCESEVFCLFCAYPKSGFTQNVNESIHHICSAHTKQIAGDKSSRTEVFYK
jgi:hypothetical protein